MIVGFARYSRDQSFSALRRNRGFVGVMAAGSIAGTFLGAHMLGIVPSDILIPILVILLLASAARVWGHQ